jgi:trehalose synthase
MATLESVPVSPVPPERLMTLLAGDQAHTFAETIKRGQDLLASRVIWNVNSTARGGGVAEMLASLLAYTRGAGLDARWLVMDGDPEFFRVTKRLHNMLHGSPGDGAGLGSADDRIFRDVAQANARELAELVRPGDVVLLHDPQTAGMIEPVRARGAHVVWRCHVGLDEPDGLAREAWDFLAPHVVAADALVFSRAAFVWEGLDPARIRLIPPSIDGFSAKNQDLSPETCTAILRVAGVEDGAPAVPAVYTRRDGTPGRVDRAVEGSASATLPPGAPAVVQVSRWDRLKDPLGVLEAFCERIGPRTGAHLVLAGPSAEAVADDPEGLDVLAEVGRHRAACPDSLRDRIHLFSLPMEDVAENAAIVNALQRRANVAVQKSLAEGFGLTVAEAMWKARPVVASQVGGIQEQIEDGHTGVLVDPTDLGAFADAVVELLENPSDARELGARAREAVRERFLGPEHLRHYVDLFEHLLSVPA